MPISLIQLLEQVMQGEKKQRIKIVFVGPPESGKSCIVSGYTQGYKPTIGVDYASYEFMIEDKKVEFQLWDISASMTFNEKSYDYCKNGQIVACVYAASDKQSFNNCQDLAERLLKENKLRYDAKAAIIASKIDLPRQVSYQQGLLASEILKSSITSFTQTYFEVSTKDEKDYMERLCKGFYAIFKDDSIKKLVQINQYQDPAPPIPVVAEPVKYEVPKNGEFEKIYKVLIKGTERCGKSALIQRFANDQQIIDYIPTIGVDFAIKIIELEGVKVKLQLWDTAGMEKFKVITNCYIKGCQGFILAYDCTNMESFKSLEQHVNDVTCQSFDPEKIVKYIVANKIDLKEQRVISKEEGEQFAKQVGYEYMQVSALQNFNVNELFYYLADRLLKSGII